MPFSDLLSVFQSPSSTTSGGQKSASYTTTPSKYSKLNRFTFDSNESPSIITTEPIVSSVSNDAVCDPSPTISRMLRKQHETGAAGRKPLETTQASCPEPKPDCPKPVIQIRNSVTSPTGKEEGSNPAISAAGVTSDPNKLSSNSVDSSNYSSSTCVDLPLPDKRQESSYSNILSASDSGEKVGTDNLMVEETTNKVADDDKNVVDNNDDKVKEALAARSEKNSVNSKYVKDESSPPLADIPPPPSTTTMYIPLHLDVVSHQDHDRYAKQTTIVKRNSITSICRIAFGLRRAKVLG